MAQIIVEGGSGGGGTLPIFATKYLMLVAPTHPDAVDDTDWETPFVTIQAAINVAASAAVAGWGVSSATGPIRVVILVAGGIYDDELVALGPVTLGNGAGSNFASTNTRNLTWVNCQDDENTGSGAAPQPPGNNRRPTLVLSTIEGWMGEVSSTHTAYAVGWTISGNLQLVSPAVVVDPFTTAELHLAGVKVVGSIVDAGVALYGPRAGITNVYAYRCMFQGGAALLSPVNMQVVESTRFQGAFSTGGTYNRIQASNIEASFTIGAFSQDVPPGGFITTVFGAGITFTGPAGSLVLDAYSNWSFKTGGCLLGGAASKVIRGDLIP